MGPWLAAMVVVGALAADSGAAPQILVNSDVTWKSPPRWVHATYRYAQVRLVMLYPDGRLTTWGCTLYRDRKTKRTWWAYGESQSVSVGTWTKKSEASIEISTKLIYADVLQCGDPQCKTHIYPERREDWILMQKSRIKTPHGKLVPFALEENEIRTFERAAEGYEKLWRELSFTAGRYSRRARLWGIMERSRSRLTLRIELPEEKTAALAAKAREHGLSPEEYARQVLEQDLLASADTRRPMSEFMREIWGDMPADVRAKLPRDGASQVDHYVYGLPKRGQ